MTGLNGFLNRDRTLSITSCAVFAGATILGLLAYRFPDPAGPYQILRHATLDANVLTYLNAAISLGGPMSFFWSLGLLAVFATARPRQGRRADFTPGIIAVALVVSWYFIACTTNLIDFAWFRLGNPEDETPIFGAILSSAPLCSFLDQCRAPIGGSIAAAWGAIVLTGGWEAEARFAGQLSRAIGFWWIFALVCSVPGF